MHEKARVGFNKDADAYDRGRPSYPIEAITFLINELSLNGTKTVLDLAAGTGKFTALIKGTRARIIAVEPVHAMRMKFQTDFPDISILDGTAEAIPLPSQSIDSVICAQAFHWFDGPLALREIERVLKPGGALALIWNSRDEGHDWVAKLTAIIAAQHNNEPSYKSGKWRNVFEGTDLFDTLRHKLFSHIHSGNRNMILDRVGSISYISALDQNTYDSVMQQVEQLIDSDPALKDRSSYELPYRTDLYWTFKKAKETPLAF